MLLPTLAAALLLAASAQPMPPFEGQPRQASRLPARPPTAEPEPERIPIDLGEEQWPSEPPQQIDILVPPAESEAANAAELKDCEDQREAGVVAGEIVVCRKLPADTSQLYSGSREAWLKDYAQRTMGPGTPDVDASGLPAGMVPMITIKGCFIGPCPKDPALMIDVEAIPLPPEGSDAERVAQGLAPVEGDDAPLSDADRRRVEAELALPAAPGPTVED